MSSRRQATLTKRYLQVVIQGDADMLRQAASLINERRMKYGVRGFVLPADAEQYSAAIDNGAIQAMFQAGFTVCAAGASPPVELPEETCMRHPGDELAVLLDAALE